MNICRLSCLALAIVVAPISLANAQAVTATSVAAQETLNAAAGQPQVGDKINFVQTSQQVTLTSIGGGDYQLVMSGVDHRVLWFADTPNGNAGLWALSHFIERWQAGSQHLVSDSPNATLVANTKGDESGEDVIKVFKVSQPQYNVQNDTLTYHAQLIFSANYDAKVAPHLYKASLFIDIVCKFGGECF